MPADGNLGKLIVEIGANLDELSKALKDGTEKIEDFEKKAAEQRRRLAVGFSVVSAAVVTAIGAMIKATVDYGDEINTLSKRTGLSTEQISKFKFVAEQTESSIEDLANSFKILSKNLFEAANGNDGILAKFEQFNVAVVDNNGNLRDSNEVFLELADKIKNTTSSTEQLALATEFFGRSGANILPVLLLGRKGIEDLSDRAQKLGLVLSKDNVEAIDEFDDNMKEFKAAVGGASLAVGQFFIPALTALVKFLTEKVLPIIEALNAALIKTGKVLSEAQVTGSFAGLPGEAESKKIVENLTKIKDLEDAIRTGGGRGASGQVAEIERLREENLNLQSQIINERQSAVQAASNAPTLDQSPEVVQQKKKDLLGIADESEFANLLNQLRDQKIEISQLNDQDLEGLQQYLDKKKLVNKTAEEQITENLQREVQKRKTQAQIEKDVLSDAFSAFEKLLAQHAQKSKAAAIALKAIQIGKAIASGAVAIQNIQEHFLPPVSYVLQAISAATTAAQIATIASVGYATGTDSVPARLSPGEIVIPNTFADAIRTGRLTLGGRDGGNGGSHQQIDKIEINVNGSVDDRNINEIVDKVREEIGLQFERRLRGAV